MPKKTQRNPLLLDILRCPVCHGPVGPARAKIACRDQTCKGGWRLTAGVLRPLGTRPPDKDGGFDEKWRRFPAHFEPREQRKETFTMKVGASSDELNGASVLDLGCGTGRFMDVALSMGAAFVLGIDASLPALEAAAKALLDAGHPPTSFALVHADAAAPVLSPGWADLGYAIGSLHHMPDPEAGFARLHAAVKPGGRLSLWVYCQPVEDRLLPLLDWLHEVTRACPTDALWEACRKHAVAISEACYPRWGDLEKILRPSYSGSPEEKIRGFFDWHCPEHRSWHTEDEVRGWFEKAGVSDIRFLEHPVGATARREG